MNKGWNIRNGVQVVTDLSACRERELDFSLPIEVEGVPADSEVSCRNTLSLISYLEHQFGIETAPLLKTVGLELSIHHLKDPHKWLSCVDSLRVFELVRRLSTSRNPRQFKEVGRHAHRYQTLGAGVDALANLLPLRRVMWIASEYGRIFNNMQFTRSIRMSKGMIVLTNKYAQQFQTTTVIDLDWWALGIYTGFPERRDLPCANGVIDYSVFSLEHLLDREYSWLGVRDHGMRSEWTYHGLARRRWFVEGEEHAHEAILLRESLVPGISAIGEDLFHPVAKEMEDFTPQELTNLLEKRMATKVWLVTKPLVRSKEIVLERGEIYGAPYSRFTLKWQERSAWKGFVETVRHWRRRLAISAEALRTEIDAAKAESMHSNRERLASEKKSIIFQTYARHSLVERIDRGEDPRLDKPIRQDLAVLFSDLRDFTQLASQMSPEDTVAFLNSYFNRQNRPIYHHRGEIDKIMGDGMMAIFNDGKGMEPMAVRAVHAAIDIRLELQAYNRERWEWHIRHAEPGEEFPRIDNGIGVAFGPVVIGNIGSDHKLDYSLIGDVVNVASRLEGLTRYYGSGILVTEEVRNLLPDRFYVRFLDTIRVKGRDMPLRIHEVYDHEPVRVKNAKSKNQFLMEEAWNLYAAGMFSESRHIYEELIRTSGPHMLQSSKCMDPSLEFFLNRCWMMESRVQENPALLGHWIGIHGFDVK